MNMGKVEQRLRSALPEELRRELLEALTFAYADAARRHEPDVGCNAVTFGTDVYQFAVHRLVALARMPADRKNLRILSIQPEFRLLAGPFTVAHYRVGNSAADDIETSFPRNDSGAGKLVTVSEQLNLELGDGSALSTGLVLASLGNYRDGLQAIYLAIPAEEKNGRIVRWGYTEKVWLSDARSSDTAVRFPPPVSVGEPELRLKRLPPSEDRTSA